VFKTAREVDTYLFENYEVKEKLKYRMGNLEGAIFLYG
jgi:hypothetical protein